MQDDNKLQEDQRSGDLHLMEYGIIDGQRNLPDSFIREFYKHLDRKEFLFYNVKDLEHWNPLPYFQFPGTRTIFGFIGGQCVGAFWITGWNHLNKTGFINYGAVKRPGMPMTKVFWGKQALRTILSMPDFQLLYGETSVSNKPAIAAAKYFGFKYIGTIPRAHWNAREERFEDTEFGFITKENLR